MIKFLIKKQTIKRLENILNYSSLYLGRNVIIFLLEVNLKTLKLFKTLIDFDERNWIGR